MIGSAAGFVGPGNVQSGATSWWGLRAYNAAYATGSNAAVDLVDQAGANPITVNILSSGALDIASINTWVTAHSVTTIRVSKLYDQVSTNHMLQANLGVMPELQLSVSGLGASLPSMHFTIARGDMMQTAGSVTLSQPIVISSVLNFDGGVTGAQGALGSVSDAVFLGYRGSINNVALSATFEVDAAATQNAFHAVQGIANTTSSEIYIDGSSSGAINVGTSGFTSALVYGSQTSGASWAGYLCEQGVWQGLNSSTFAKSSMNSNQHTYWGF